MSIFGIDRCLSEALKGRDFTTPVGDAVFAMVANRALAPASRLAVEEWAARDVHLDIEQPIQVHTAPLPEHGLSA